MNKFNASHTSDSPIPVLDYKNCNQTLSSQLPLSDNDSLLLASQLNKIILDNISLKPKRNPPSATNSSKIDLLKREVNVALSRLIYFPNEANKQYLIASRKSLSKEISINSKKFKETQLAEAITNARENGISSLFKAAKNHPKASSCAVPLHQWKEFYSNLYHTHPSPSLPSLHTAASELGSNVLLPTSTSEIFNTIRKQKSKAKDLCGISPVDLKSLAAPLSEWLCPIFNDILSGKTQFPSFWLNSLFFFLHKKGVSDNPSNYRSLAIESPFLKIFSSMLNSRLYHFAENANILPDFQFGFRKGHSTTSAALLLQQSINLSLNNKKMVFACFK